MTSNNTVFFDLGNVLLFFSHEKMVDQLARCTKLPRETLRHHLLQTTLLEKYESGHMSTDELFCQIQALGPCSFSHEEAKVALSDIFIPNTALWPIVEQLKAQGTRLVLISNTNECHFNFAYSNYSILKHFDRFILSYEVGACKPKPLIFERALEEARGSSFYTDDIPEYIRAAKAAGLDGEVYTDVPNLKRHLKERNFLE